MCNNEVKIFQQYSLLTLTRYASEVIRRCKALVTMVERLGYQDKVNESEDIFEDP